MKKYKESVIKNNFTLLQVLIYRYLEVGFIKTPIDDQFVFGELGFHIKSHSSR